MTTANCQDAPPYYTLTDLGAVTPRQINRVGEVAGTSGGRGFYYDGVSQVLTGVVPGTTFSDAEGIDLTGRLVGLSGSQPAQFFVRSGAALALPDPSGGVASGSAHAANRDFAVGYVNKLVFGTLLGKRAVRWAGGTGVELTIPAGAFFSEANDVNASGQIAGWSSTPDNSANHARRWDSVAVSTDLHTLTTPTRSFGRAINSSGVVVGTAYSTSIAVDAAAFVASGGVMTLLAMPPGTPRSEAFDINDAGDIVGLLNPAGVAVLWHNGAPYPLASRLAPPLPDWQLQVAYSINDRGEIVGYGKLSGVTRGFLLRPTTLPCAGLKWEMLDPAAPHYDAVGKKSYPMLGARDVTRIPELLATGGTSVDGLVADGTTRLLLRFTATEAGTVNVSLAGAADGFPAPVGSAASDGRFGLPGESPAGSSVSASTAFVAGSHRTFVIYHAPSEFPASLASASEREIVLKATLTNAAGCETTRFIPVKVERPPLVVMHGIWSSRDEAFGTPAEGFIKEIRTRIPKLRVSGPNYPNAAPLITNLRKVADEIEEMRRILRGQRLAMCQADVVGHSMGGVLSRMWASWGNDFYNRPENYRDGDINRLVTIDSPHCGAWICNTINFTVDHLPEIPREELLYFFRLINKPVDDGAVRDLATGSPAITDLTGRFNAVPAHAIIGNFTVPVDLCHDPVLNLPPFNPAAIFCAMEHFGIPVSGNLPVQSDLIVGASNQAGRLGPGNTTTFDHQHSGAANRLEVIDVCATLLRSDPASTVFAHGFPFGCDADSFIPFIIDEAVKTSHAIGLTSPPAGGTFVPGQAITLTAERTGGTDVEQVVFVLNGRTQSVTSAPFTTSMTIPTTAVGEISLSAHARHAGPVHTSTIRTLTVVPAQSLISLAADPASLRLYSTASNTRVTVLGTYSDGVVRDLTDGATGTAWSSSAPGVATVDVHGWITAVADGSATLTATHGAKSITVPVQVDLVRVHDGLALTSVPASIGVIEHAPFSIVMTAINNGTAGADSAKVSLDLPGGISLTNLNPSAGSWMGTGGEVVWTIGTLPSGGSAVANLEFLASAPGSFELKPALLSEGIGQTAAASPVIPVRVFANPKLVLGASSATATFQTQSGVRYALEATADPAGGWTEIGSVVGAGGESSLPAPVLGSRRFFRLRLSIVP